MQLNSPVKVIGKHNPETIIKAIHSLQATNAFNDIQDPVAWQQEIRRDRDLPDRE